MALFDAAATHFGVVVAEQLGGEMNEHWLASRDGERLVLGRLRADTSLASAIYEETLRARLIADRVCVPHSSDKAAVIDGRVWTLMSYLPGEDAVTAQCGNRRRGELLARLHKSLRGLTDLGQRDGRVFADQVIESPTLDASLAWLESVAPDDARLMHWHRDRARELLAAADLRQLPVSIIHGDFAPWNLLFVNDELTGILDWEFAHLDYRVAEFALSWRGKYDALVHGFDSLMPLADLEWELLTPIRWAWIFIGVEPFLRRVRAGELPLDGLQWNIDQLLRRSALMGRESRPYAG